MPIKNITGARFGRLVAENLAPETPKDGSARWICRCDCGNLTEARGTALRYGKIKSCGCLRDNPIHNLKPVDLVGKRFGRLTVIERVGLKHATVRWRCSCDCGELKLLRTGMLTTSGNKSCGCMQFKGRASAPKVGIYFIAFANGMTKFGRSANLRQRLISYRMNFLLSGGGVAFCAPCEDQHAAEARLIQGVDPASKVTDEVFWGVPLAEAKRLLLWASRSDQGLIDATVLLTGPGPVSLLQR